MAGRAKDSGADSRRRLVAFFSRLVIEAFRKATSRVVVVELKSCCLDELDAEGAVDAKEVVRFVG